MQRKFFRAIFRRTVLLEPTRADSSDIRVDSDVEQQTFLGKTVLLEPTRADSWDIRVGSNVEQAFCIKPYGRPKHRSQSLKP